RSVGIDIGDVAGDTALAAYLLVPDQRSYELRDIAAERAGIELAAASAKDGQLSLDLDTDATARTHGTNAAALIEVHDVLATAIDEANMTQVYRDIELPLVPVLAGMEMA
ncbi:UNVERIFIED_CONTAM: DNA polymerase I, partial [Salmonella enterica subsp. enterica serovar Weltevreden]